MSEIVVDPKLGAAWNSESLSRLQANLATIAGQATLDTLQLRTLMDQVSELGNSGAAALIATLSEWLHARAESNRLFKLADAKLEAARALRSGHLELAIRSAEEARSLAIQTGWEFEAAAACTMLGIVQLRRGDYVSARRSMEEAVVAARRAGIPEEEGRALQNLALVLKNTGHLREAEAALRSARDLVAEAGNLNRVARCDLNLSSVLYRRGFWALAASQAKLALDHFLDRGLPASIVSAELALGRALRAQGTITEARELLERALVAARESGAPRSIVVALEFVADCDLASGDPQLGRDRYSEALLRARELGSETDLVVECSRGLALAELALGDHDSALAHANESVDLATTQHDLYELSNSLLARGLIRAQLNDASGAKEDALSALSFARECGDRFAEARAVLWLAADDLGRGHAEHARSRAATAEGLFSELGLSDWRERARAGVIRAHESAMSPAGERSVRLNELSSPMGGVSPVNGFLTVDPRVRRTLATIASLAPQTLNILVLGESGTGKELIAQAVHDLSGRKGPFVPVNCSAFPGDLIEGELFGHARGAYTGADRERVGLFEYAHKGTLFLDEIGDMPVKAQARLLRALENGEVRRLGENNSRTVDVRVVAATHRHLLEMVGAGEFRLDLYYRLAGYVVDLPPVRERKEDAKLLVDYFLAKFAKDQGKTLAIAAELRSELSIHSWPGNVREIKMVMQRLVSLTPSGTTIRSLPFGLEGDPRPRSLPELLEAEEKKRILDALQAHNWNKARAATTLGTNRTTLIGKMKRMGIELSKQR